MPLTFYLALYKGSEGGMGVPQVHGFVWTIGRPPQDMLGLGVSQGVCQEVHLRDSSATLRECLCHLMASSRTQHHMNILATLLCVRVMVRLS